MTRTVSIIGTRGYPSYYGGFETLVRHLAPYLADHGWKVVVYGRPGEVDDIGERDDRIQSVITSGIETKSFSTLTYGLTSALHSYRHTPDVALVMNVANGFWLPLLRARHIPTLVNVDGIEWEREKWGRGAKFVFRVGARLTARFATSLVYDSTELGTKWQKFSGREGIYIAYGGAQRADRPVVDGLSCRKYVLMVARFVPENTIEPFLDAARVLSEKWQVVIVGSSGYQGPFDKKVEELAATCENVRWFGHVSDDEMLFSLWENAGAYFHGHSVGGTNPALVQAMACGAPTVARDTPFNREVLEGSAVYVPPEAGAIAEAIDSLISDSDKQDVLSVAARQRAQSSYTWEKVCAAYDSALREHVSRTPTRALSRRRSDCR